MEGTFQFVISSTTRFHIHQQLQWPKASILISTSPTRLPTPLISLKPYPPLYGCPAGRISGPGFNNYVKKPTLCVLATCNRFWKLSVAFFWRTCVSFLRGLYQHLTLGVVRGTLMAMGGLSALCSVGRMGIIVVVIGRNGVIKDKCVRWTGDGHF